jgi:hypothetical protein
MDMIFNATDQERRTFQGFGNTAELRMQCVAHRLVGEKWATFFGGENQMDVNGGEGLGHASGGLAQPRWGCCWFRTLTQGSSFLTTLGFGTIPRWGIQTADFQLKRLVHA